MRWRRVQLAQRIGLRITTNNASDDDTSVDDDSNDGANNTGSVRL